jgi:hypothetical protein
LTNPDHVRALAQRRPARKSAQVRWFWPQIHAALAAGHSIADVRRELALDGLDISYSKLRTYVARLRKQAPPVQAPAQGSKPAGSTGSDGPPASTQESIIDPLYNVRRQLERKKQFYFEYNPFPDPKDDIH